MVGPIAGPVFEPIAETVTNGFAAPEPAPAQAAEPLTSVNDEVKDAPSAIENNETNGLLSAVGLRTVSNGIQSGLLNAGTNATSQNIVGADYYRIEVRAGDVLDLNLTKTGGGASGLKVQLYYAEVDGGGLTYVDEAFEVGITIAHQQIAEADGFYYLSVNSASLASAAEIRYKLEWDVEADDQRTLDREADAFEGFEGNDTFQTAGDLRSLSPFEDSGLLTGTTVDRSGSTQDRDWFRLELNAGDSLRVALDHTDAGDDSELFLQFLVADTTGVQPLNLNDLYVEGTQRIEQNFTADRDGVYYINTGAHLQANDAVTGYELSWDVI